MNNLIFINEEAIKGKSRVTKFKYINEAVEIFEKLIEDYGSQIENTKVIPCSIKEVNALESKLSPPYKLPAAYKEFLLYGGTEMAGLSGVSDIFYGKAKLLLNYPNEAYDLFCDEELEGQAPPAEMFFITEYLGAYTAYFQLDEGDDPPVYEWKEEYGDNELDTVKKSHNSFSEYLKKLIISYLLLRRRTTIDENLDNNNPPRGKQFWIATDVELVQGLTYPKQMDALGFIQYIQLEKAASLSGLDPYSYLEELSGWKAQKVGDEIRFFPPSNVAK